MRQREESNAAARLRVDRYLHTGSFPAFKATFLSGFVLAFFGIGFYRLWYQFNFYNLHFSADVGMVTVGANIARVAVIAVLVFLVYRAGFTRATRSVFLWSGFLLMTASSLLYLLDLFFDSTQFEALRVVVGGIGLVGGEIIWIFFFERLKPGQMFFYAAGGLALSCVLSLLLGYIDAVFAGVINLFVPAFSVFAYWQAMSKLDERDGVSRSSADQGAFAAPDLLYEDGELKKGVLQVIVAFFAYGLLLGIALGYPDGRLRELSQTVRSVHQVLVMVLVLGVVWMVLIRGRSFKLSGYWLFQNVLMMASICLLVSGWEGSEEASTFLLTNAVTCFYIPLVFFICLIGRHVHWPTTLVYAVVYGGSLLCMAIGRMVVYLVGPTLDHSLWLIIVMALVALAETTLIMRPRFMGTHPIGFELELLPKELPLEVRAAHEDHSVGAFAADYGLTGTEEAIVCLIAQGRSRSFIARELGYSENTIRNYTRTVYRKANVHSKQELLDKLMAARGTGS